ncbi:DUF6057 family protein [Massilibacteroides sp.]|uniref:DUF6057 family protein n=1 Tax=Massilibacteroides sp. TaxID=2034766 RepID=UPI002624BBC1|nr:DUF6057 family protein [Massilibacteroides sp.]MDD4516676.1 DUF6057 family protein [Massilibacteroides sp.]
MMKKWSYSIWGVFAILVITLFVFLQQEYAYHFFFIEQNYMFQSSLAYAESKFILPGGFIEWTGEFLMQFFMYPYVGATITVVLLVLIALLTNGILQKINKGYDWLIASAVPSLFLLFMHFDFNYMLAGTVAFLFMLAVFRVAILIKHAGWRLIYHCISVCLLYWLCGSVFTLYIVLTVLFEFLSKSSLRYWSLVLIPFGGLLGFLSLSLALQGEYRFVFLPDMFYHNNLSAKTHIYFSWIVLVVLFIFAFIFKPQQEKKNWRRIVELLTSFILVLLLFGWGVGQHGDQKAKQVKKLDYFVRAEQWDNIIKESDGLLTNYLYLCYLNMALAEKGELAERMFLYDQRGIEGLMLKWNRTFSISVMLSDVYFVIGNVAIAQEMAFEAYISSMGGGNPRMLKRLIQTNLIYGEYKVAGKYIDLLEQTLYYKDWAKEQRRFLYNDEAVESDPLLGEKRRGLVDNSYLSNTQGFAQDLISLAEHYPANKNAIEYLGASLLLTKDMQGFKSLLETYYGTDILPELPLGFQEAVIILFENTPDEWEKYSVSMPVIDRFTGYKRAILANKHSQSLPQLMARDFANTYWFYFMFK